MESSISPEVQVLQILAIATGLEIYSKTKRQVARAYTPKAMMQTAARLTGQTFRARDYLGAAQALRALLPKGENLSEGAEPTRRGQSAHLAQESLP